MSDGSRLLPQPPTCGDLRPALCSLLARGGFRFLSLSPPLVSAPPLPLTTTSITTTHRLEWQPPPHFNKPFHRGQFSFLHAVSWALSFHFLRLPHFPPSHPSSMACARPHDVYWPERLEGLAFHRGSCCHHVPPSQAAGRRHAGRCLAHPRQHPPEDAAPQCLPHSASVRKTGLCIVYQGAI